MDLARRQPADLEMKPLIVAAVGVRADGQVHLGRVDGVQYLDVAGIESAVDLQGDSVTVMCRAPLRALL